MIICAKAMGEFKQIDLEAINTIRVLAADVVQKANSGHPGAPMGLAPLAHVLFSRHFNCSPKNSQWLNRDRFVLSNGHACVLQYIMLHLLGYKLSMDDLKQFRQLNSVTAGHPESHLTDGVEVTTGPLGQGIANAVGLAIAQKHFESKYNSSDFSIFNSKVYCMVGDGCLQEGIASEACSLAGHLQLDNLIVLYDDNKIQIDGSTDQAFSEDVLKRFEAYGFCVDSVANGDDDLDAIHSAISKAKSVKGRPSFIKIRTTIGRGASKEGTEKVHGSALGEQDVAAVKKKYGFNPSESFVVPGEVYKHYEQIAANGAAKESEWNDLFKNFQAKHSEVAGQLLKSFGDAQYANRVLPLLPRYKPSDSAIATRKLSETLLNKIAPALPELIGGSADLTASNLTKWKDSTDFQGPAFSQLGNYAGSYIRFGVREHAMCAIANGLAAFGGLLPFGATFLNFISYGLGAVRLSALSHLQVLYIMTHDSIGLGEDGPTHQPVETLASLRALPNMVVLRPADGNEVSGAYLAALENKCGPSTIVLTRQNLPQLENSSVESVLKGAYVLVEDEGAQITLISTGSEVAICVDTREALLREGIKARIVSAPSLELFDKQSLDYKHSVLVPGVPVLSFEVLSTFGWHKYAHASFGLDQFGVCGPYQKVYDHFEFNVAGLSKRVKAVVNYYKGREIPSLIDRPF